MTKAIDKELVAADYRPRKAWPDPTPEMLETSMFEAIWQCIKSWDINVPDAYNGYCGATGNHVRAITDAITQSQAVDGPSFRIVGDSITENKTEMMGALGMPPVIDKDALLREAKTLCEWLMNSDMAIREGDEGQESPVLDKIDETLKKLQEAGY